VTTKPRHDEQRAVENTRYLSRGDAAEVRIRSPRCCGAIWRSPMMRSVSSVAGQMIPPTS
jgi:hypothetical protein